MNLDLGWSPSDGTTAYGYYSFEHSRIAQANVNDSSANISGSPYYGGNVYLTQDAWNATSKDRSNVLGLGFKTSFAGKNVLDLAYSLTSTSTDITYGYLDAGGALLGTPGAALPDLGNAFPDMTYRLHSLQGSLLVPVSSKLSLRFITRYDQVAIKDWHYTGLTAGAVPSNTGGLLPITYIDRGPSDYHSIVVGVFVQNQL